MNFFKKIFPKVVAFLIIVYLSFTFTGCPSPPTETLEVTEETIEEVTKERNHPPKAVAGENLEIEVGVSTLLAGEGSSDPDEDILTYTWDFGDGRKAYKKYVYVKYDETGTYKINLTVSDGEYEDSDTLTIKVISSKQKVSEETIEDEVEDVKESIPDKLDKIELTYSLEFRQYLESLGGDYLENILYDEAALKEEYDLFEWKNIFYKEGIVFTADEDIFPLNWYEPDINAKAESLAESEIERSRRIILSALDKYPAEVLKKNLEKLYVLKFMNFFGVDFGATYAENCVYVANNGIDRGYTDLFIEKEFHHEFSSILFENYYYLFKESEWRQINPVDFVYFDEETRGVTAIKEERASVEFDPKLHEVGFLYEYAQSDLENDLNSFAENIFAYDGNFFEMIEEYEKLSLKLELIIEFYNSINPKFTTKYFKEISSFDTERS